MSPTSSRTQRSRARGGRTVRTPVAPQTGRSGRRADAPRGGAPPRRVGVAGGWIQRRQPKKKQSGLAKTLGGLGGAASRLGKGRAKPVRSSGKAKRGGQVGGLALLTAAAGFAFKNREKVTAMLRRDQHDAAQPGAEAGVTSTPTTPPPTGVPSAGPPETSGTVTPNDGPQG